MGDPKDIKTWFTEPLPSKQREEFRKEVKADIIIDENAEGTVECPECEGSGWCEECDGEGEVEHYCDCEYCRESYVDCEDCYSDGKCSECDGTGMVEEF